MIHQIPLVFRSRKGNQGVEEINLIQLLLWVSVASKLTPTINYFDIADFKASALSVFSQVKS